MPDEPAPPVEPVAGQWRYFAADPSNPNFVTRAWVPVDQVAAAANPAGATAAGTGEWVSLPSGEAAFVPADELRRTVRVDGRTVRAFVPGLPADHDCETERGAWVEAIVAGPRGPVRRQVFIEHADGGGGGDGQATAEPGYVDGATACRMLGRSLSFLRAQVARGEVRTSLAGKRVLYSSADVGAVANGQSPSRIRQEQAEASQRQMAAWLADARPATAAPLATPRTTRDLPDAARSFVAKFGGGGQV
ncbi:MAG: hypothetical protein ACYC61_17830 [Isosphaeraceae bacterium]